MSIILDHVNYIYGADTPQAVYALKDISLKIDDGQFVGIIGHTGSGKSTLMQHMNGLIKATEGHIYYNGEDIYDDDYDMKKLRSKVGLVFQYPEHQLFEIDVFSDVCFGPKNLGLDKKEAELRAFDALRKVGFPNELFYQSPFELSGGQKRRAAIAGVLAMKPEVLILDEPTAGLDPKGRDEILQQVKQLQKETGMTILLVSHSMEDVAEYVDRLIVMNDGSILFDGIDIRKIRKADLRRNIAIIVQTTHLFSGTIADNIRYGRIDAGDEDVIEAAKLAHADSFIRRLPDGYRTVLRNDGDNLSQGQRQLLAIARAAIAKPRVLVLDEATSSIDTRTEHLIEEGLDSLMEGRTVLVIAHRLSTVRNSDEIMVIEKGRIIEHGSHEELIRFGGEYAKLYSGLFELG